MCFLYSLNDNVVSESMCMLVKLIKRDSARVEQLFEEVHRSCKDYLVHTHLLQIIFNLADVIDLQVLKNIYLFCFENLKTHEMFGVYWFWMTWFLNGIREFIELRTGGKDCIDFFSTYRMITGDEVNKLDIIDDSTIASLYRTQNQVENKGDITLYSYDNEDFSDYYYKCQNEIINAFCNNGDSHWFNFITSILIDDISPLYRTDFLKNVLVSIFRQGYSYMRFGFCDYDKDSSVKYAEKYEKLALNEVLYKYIGSLLSENENIEGELEGIVRNISFFTEFDGSIPEELKDLYWYSDSIESIYNQLEKALKERAAWVPLTFPRFDSYDVYLMPKENVNETMVTGEIRKYEALEDVYFNEIYQTKHFYQALSRITKPGQLWFKYLWDFTPFLSLGLLHPDFIELLGLNVGADKCYYYKNDNLVCKNLVYERKFNQLVISREYLEVLSESYKIIWCFENNRQIDFEYYKMQN